MPGQMSGPGVGLQLPQNLYPTELLNAPYDFSTNRVCLAPGQQLPISRGDWFVSLGSYCMAEYLDPVTNTWQFAATCGWQGGTIFVQSDGFNWRVSNLLGCVVGAVVTSYGSSYVQATTTIAVTGSTATLLPIVGGQLAVSGTFSVAVPTVGGGYGIAPIVYIPAPPPATNNANGVGGIQASGYVGIANGTVNGFTLTNPGAGYPTAPTPVVLPNPTDPNLATGITAAVLAVSTTGSGSITGVLRTNPGAAITPANVTLTVSGAGTQGTVSAVVLQTITAASVTGAGAGFGTVAALMSSVGGGWPTGTITNSPEFLGLAFRPRPAQVSLAVTGAPTLGSIAAQVGTIIDGGLFASAPTPALGFPGNSGTVGSIVGPTITLTTGSRPDIVILQPALAS